eukprot:UN01087
MSFTPPTNVAEFLKSKNNLNWVRNYMYMPFLPQDKNITFVGFYRRKPRGFSNGHYLQCNPAAFSRSATARRNYVAVYAGCFAVYGGLFAYAQYQKSKWWWFPYTPQYFSQEDLKEMGYKV